MPEIKWTTLSQVNPQQNYFAYAALAERKTAWSYFSYLMRARKIQNQLNHTEGIVGFTARLDFLSKKVIQLAVFKNENSLKEFAHSGQHANCMANTKSSMKWLKQSTWNILGSEIPPNMPDALNRIEAEVRT